MSINNATEYADSLAASIISDGLGVIDTDTDQWYCNAEDAEALDEALEELYSV